MKEEGSHSSIVMQRVATRQRQKFPRPSWGRGRRIGKDAWSRGEVLSQDGKWENVGSVRILVSHLAWLEPERTLVWGWGEGLRPKWEDLECLPEEFGLNFWGSCKSSKLLSVFTVWMLTHWRRQAVSRNNRNKGLFLCSELKCYI